MNKTVRVDAVQIRVLDAEPSVRWVARMKFKGEVARAWRPAVLAFPVGSSHVERSEPSSARVVGRPSQGRRIGLVLDRSTWDGVELELTFRTARTDFIHFTEHFPQIDPPWRAPITQPQLSVEGDILRPYGLIDADGAANARTAQSGLEFCLTCMNTEDVEPLAQRLRLHLAGDVWRTLRPDHRTHVISTVREVYEELLAFTQLPVAGSLLLALDPASRTASCTRGSALRLPLAWFLENGSPTGAWRHLIAAQLADLWWGTLLRLPDGRGAAVTLAMGGAIATWLSTRQGSDEARQRRRAVIRRRIETTRAMPWERSTRVAIASWQLALALDDWLMESADAPQIIRALTHRWAGAMMRTELITREFAQCGVAVPRVLL